MENDHKTTNGKGIDRLNAALQNTHVRYLIVFAVAIILGIMLAKSRYLFIIYLILVGTSVCSFWLARPVMRVQVELVPKKGVQLAGWRPREFELVKQPGKGYCGEISLDTMIADDSSCIYMARKSHEPLTITDDANTSIRVQSLMGFGCRCQIANGDANMLRLVRVVIKPVGNNKFNVVIAALFCIGILLAMCDWFYKRYNAEENERLEHLTANLSAIAANDESHLACPSIQTESDTLVYYPELPQVHLIVITKEDGSFLHEDSQFLDPLVNNTVLMLYEDNATGGLIEDDETETPTEATSEDDGPEMTYFNITELYMGLPVQGEDGELHMMGELFGGTLPYGDATGYDAVAAWFRDKYHICIASVTEIPQSVFASCFSDESGIAVNLHTGSIRSLYQNYCVPLDSLGTTHALDAMLQVQRPTFSEDFRRHVQEQYERYDLTLSVNMLLTMGGKDLTSFGNTVRECGQAEYDYLQAQGYFDDKAAFPEEEWKTRSLTTMVHSNWDILLCDILESLTNINNGTFHAFCETDNTEALGRIRTTLPPETLRGFLRSLIDANNVLDNEHVVTQEYCFFIRNLKLRAVTSTLGETNRYLLAEPMEIAPYTDRRVKTALFFCLHEPKAAT